MGSVIIASTYLCRHYNIVADFPMTLIATAVVFPIVFSIGGAYKRRENALVKYSSIKAHGRAIYFATRDFSKLSEFINQDLRGKGLPSGEASRCNQFLSKMDIAFEDVKHIYQYRTPRTLSAFSDFFVSVLPVVYGPYFAAKASSYSSGRLM